MHSKTLLTNIFTSVVLLTRFWKTAIKCVVMFACVFNLTGTIRLRDSATRRTVWRTSRNTSIDDLLCKLSALRLLLNLHITAFILRLSHDVLGLCWFWCRWFEGFNWDGIREGTLTPPFIPNVSQILERIRQINNLMDFFLFQHYLYIYVSKINVQNGCQRS